MPILIYFGDSNRKDKRFKIVLENPKQTFHFGFDGANTWIDGADEKVKENYIKRHKVREDWTKINNGSLSRFIIWGESRDVLKNLKKYTKMFDIKIPKGVIIDIE